MRVVHGYPPNHAELKRLFDPPAGTVFAWGQTIYAPDRPDLSLPEHLLVHEEVHARQQAASGGPAAWWQRYCDDPKFRLDQEIEAYRAQWRYIRASSIPRPERRELLAYIAKSLASRMYGGLVTKSQARALILSA